MIDDETRWAYLVAWEDQSISNNDVLPPTGGENDDLGDILRCKWLTVATAY
jgi:hypothetical protein